MKKILLILLLLLSVYLIIPQSLTLGTFFAQDEIEKMDSGELLPQMYIKYNARKENSVDNIAFPKNKYLDDKINDYEIKADEKGFMPYKLTPESKLKFYNTLTSFSNLAGMKYYSRRAGKTETLIKECYRVKSMSGNKYEDVKYDKIEPKVSNMFFQEDNKVGSFIYRSDLYNDGDNFILINTCLEPITKLVFTLNEKEEYQIGSFFIYDSKKEGFYYYTFLAMRVRVDSILKLKQGYSPTTFSNRLRAASVQLANLLGLKWDEKLNAWPGTFDSY